MRCEDYDKRNRIKLTKTAQGWRSIPRTTSNGYTIAVAAACKKTSSGMADTSPASSVSSNDEKENGKRCLQEPSATASSLRCHPRIYSSNGTTNGLLTGEDAGRKRRGYDEEANRYSSALGARDGATWNSGSDQDRSNEINDDKAGEKNSEEDKNCKQNKLNDRLSNLKSKNRLNGWINLQRLQMDKLFQPRVVLELLQLSQLPESAHQNVVHQTRNKDATVNEAKQIEENNKRDEENAVAEEDEEEREEEMDNEEEVEEEKNSEKSSRMNKAGIQDILNMIDATASPVLATDTPSADLPVDSTKTYEVLDEKQSAERQQVKDAQFDDVKDRTRSVSSYETEAIDQDGEIDDKLEVHEEKILEEHCCLQEEMEDKKIRVDNLTLLLKNNDETTPNSCKIAEADGGFVVDRPKCGSDSLVMLRPSISTEEEEAPDEPGEPLKLDYDSSKILDALRNTPGLSVSVMRNYTPEFGKNPIVSPARPPSKASSSSRSPDSQAECVEKLLKNADFIRDDSARNLPGLSIVIPSYRYKNASGQLTTASPSTKHRVESPESTVSFNKADAYPDKMKIDGFPHEEDGEEEEDEDDCDSQVLEDLRQQKADSLAYDGVDADCNGPNTRSNQEDRKTPLENVKSDPAWIGSGKNSEAQAKGKYQDLEHFDEQVLEELRSRGTVVSPQPSGIPCSPASRRPSSAYLERLLPSPPCSVSCSEDAKSELTLKSILASSSCVDYEKTKEGISIRSDQSVDQTVSRPVHSSVDRNARRTNQRSFQERLNVHNQEAKSSGRPMSSGDIHSTFYATTERAAPKRPMSAEWQPTTGQRQRIHTSYYQKTIGRTKDHFADQNQDQITCATSSSTDKLLDPARQLRELIETVGHLIPDPLLVPRDYLPGLAAAPATEIPKLLASRPELRLPEALTRPDLLRDPDLLVISLAHLQHVLDHGEGPVSRSRHSQPQQPKTAVNGTVNKGSSGSANSNDVRGGRLTGVVTAGRPKLSCKPICTLMPTQPIDLSNGGRSRINPYSPLLRVRRGLLKQEPEVSSTASSPDESQLWHPLFGR